MWLNSLSSLKIYLAAGATDLRRSFDGLAGLVREKIDQDPLSGSLFVFCNRSRNRIRMLHWDGTGYWVFAKRLEKGTFAWPSLGTDPGQWQLDAQRLSLILSGFDLRDVKPRRWYGRGPKTRTRRHSA